MYRAVINTTYHFQVDKIRFYSVPYQYVGKKAKVVYDAETVEVWVDFVRIAAHKRLYTEGYSTIAEHMPPNHLAYLKSKDITAAYLLSKASLIGTNTRASIDCISNLHSLFSKPTGPAKAFSDWPFNMAQTG